MNLLLVDPKTARSAAMAKSLADEFGIAATCFQDSGLALESALRSRPDGILFAVEREEAYLQLRRLRHELPDIPVIVSSNRDDAASVRRALSSGATDYLVEPKAGEVAYALLRILERFGREGRYKLSA